MLGVLYEHLVHPLTILSTLPSASLGALLVLTGIVKKNGIMLVDFALEAERKLGLPPPKRPSGAPVTNASGRS